MNIIKEKKIAILSPIDLNFFKKYIKQKIPFKIIESGGGTANFICKYLIDQKQNLIIITLTSKIKKNKVFSGKNFKIYLIPKNKNLFEKIISFIFFYNFFEIYRIYKILKKEKPDLINSHFWYELSVAAKLSGFPYLITGHDRAKELLKNINFFKSPISYFRLFCRFSSLKFILSNNEIISVVSRNIKKILIKNNINKKKIYIIRNAASFNKYKNRTKKKEFNIISIMNNFTEFKNPKLIIKSFNYLINKIPYAKLYLFGNQFGVNEKAFIWARKNKFYKNIIFKGYQDPKKLRKFLSIKGNLLLNLSLEESHSNSCIDGFGAKVPVLIYKRCEGTFETIYKGKYGFFINTLNPLKISDFIKKLENNRFIMLEKANDAYLYALKNLNKKKIIMQYMHLYNKKIDEFNFINKKNN